MSRASRSLTPRSGIALFGLTAWGCCNQRTMFSGVLGSTPAMKPRVPISFSGGPTGAFAPTIPGISWQVTHAYWLIAFFPRPASAAEAASPFQA